MRLLRLVSPLLLVLACDPGEHPGNPSLLQGLGAGAGGSGSASKGGNDPGKGGTGGTGKGGTDPGKGGTGGSGGGVPSKGGTGGGGGTDNPGKGGTGSGPQAGTGGTGGGGIPGLKYPLTLTPLANPQITTADHALFFAVTDAAGKPVTQLGSDDFELREDSASLAKSASGFRAGLIPASALDVPTVILLDLAGNVGLGPGGGLELMKQAATAIIDAALPEQRLAVMSFADSAKVRVAFTKDKLALKTAIAAIKDKDGLASNLYGAVSTALGQWEDGFVGTGSTGHLTSGMLIVLTDGADTGGPVKLPELVQQRGNKRVIAVGIGNQVEAAALKVVGNAGYLGTASFNTLTNDIAQVNASSHALAQSMYSASYCSLETSGSHVVFLYPKGNTAPTTDSFTTCPPAMLTSETLLACGDPFARACGNQEGGAVCCPSGAPYRCAKTSQCYGTAEAANQACGSMGTCLACGAASEDDVYLQPGPYLQLAYNAKGHDAKQCSAPWGPTCRAAAACCSSLAGSLAQQCANALVSTQGNETACPTITKQQCPSYGPQCAAYKACCETLGAEALRDACLAAARNYASAGNESQCQAESKQKCPPGGG